MKNKQLLLVFGRLIRLLKVDRKEISQIYIYAIFTGFLSLVLPLGIQSVINLVQAGKTSTSWIVIVFFVVLSIGLMGILQLLQLRITENLEQKLFVRASFELGFRFGKSDSGSIDRANRFFDVMTIQKGLSKVVIDVPGSLLQMLFGLILLSVYHPFFIAFSVLLVILLFITLRYSSIRGLNTSIKESSYKYKTANWLQEIASSAGFFKSTGDRNYHLSRMDNYVSDYINAKEQHYIVLKYQYLKLIGFKVLIALALLLIGGLLVINQKMNLGQFIASEIIILLVMGSVEKLILSLATVYDLLTGLEKIGEITDEEIEADQQDRVIPDWKGTEDQLTVTVSSVNFTGSAISIGDLNIEVRSGQHLAIMSGSELVTGVAMRMLNGIFMNVEGKVILNQVLITPWNRKFYWDKVGAVLSSDRLFKGSIFDNIQVGRTVVTTQKVIDVCKFTGLTEWINSLRDGINTEISDEDLYLTPLIRKRILLARAIAGHPKLLLLEEVVDEFGLHGDEELIQKLLDERNEWTVVAIVKSEQNIQGFRKVIVCNENGVQLEANTKDITDLQQIKKLLHA